MIEINKITELDDKRHIALLDTTSISFMQGLSVKGLQPEVILKDYDLVLIPEWVLTEINDAPGRADYVQKLIEQGYPIYCIEEGAYTDLANAEEGNLYQIVLASTSRLARIRSYLRQYIGKADPLDMDAYKDWIKKLYDEWPIPGETLSNGRIRKKNAGEVSITILAEIVSWYYPETKALTVYSQDGDTYEFQRKVLIEDANSELNRFALLFEFDGDVKHIRHVLYNCSASRPGIEGKTNEESREIQTETLTIKATPLPSGVVKAKTGNETDSTVYADWYKAVYMPTLTGVNTGEE